MNRSSSERRSRAHARVPDLTGSVIWGRAESRRGIGSVVFPAGNRVENEISYLFDDWGGTGFATVEGQVYLREGGKPPVLAHEFNPGNHRRRREDRKTEISFDGRLHRRKTAAFEDDLPGATGFS